MIVLLNLPLLACVDIPSRQHQERKAIAMSSPPADQDARTAYPFVPIPFLDLLGAKRESVADGKARLSLELQPQLRNLYDGFHGGVIMTLLDVAMASAAVSRSDFKNTVVTVDISVSFLAPASGKVIAEAEATGGGKSMCFCEGRVLDPSGKLLARALGTFKYLKLTDNTRSPQPETRPPRG
jgi:uncharacterized protein (TIGR00369 family)